MLSRNTNATALRRLMTEYKQLTANGSPDDMFTAGQSSRILCLIRRLELHLPELWL